MKNVLLLLIALCNFGLYAQISVTNTQTPEQLVTNILAGTGITVSNVEFNASAALAQVPQAQVGFFSATGTTFPITSGLILATGNAGLAVGPNDSGGATDNTDVAADPDDIDLDAISSVTYNDEAILEFDFVPIGDSLEFKFIFASEEWHEFSLGFNDAFAFFLSGPGIAGPFSNGAENIALLPGTTTPVTMFNVNNGTTNAGPCVNCQYLIDNDAGLDVQYDAHTVVLTAAASLQCGQTYHIKLVIGDAVDMSLDSGVFLEANSFSSPLPQVSVRPVDENGDLIADGVLPEGCIDASLLLIKPIGYTDSVFVMDLAIGGTATNGTDYTQINSTYTLPVGVDTLALTISAFLDGLTEGNETLTIGTFFLTACGDTINIVDTLIIADVSPDYNLVFDDVTLACPTDSLLLTVQTDGGIPNIDYLWDHSGETTNTVWVSANNVGTTYYPVLATDFCGITAYDSIEVTVNPSTPPTINFRDDYIFTCATQAGVTLAVDNIVGAFDPSALIYTWSPAPASNNADSVTVFPTNTINWFYLTVFDGCNMATDSVQVEVGRARIDSVSLVPALGCAGTGNAAGEISVFPLASGWVYALTGNGVTLGPQTTNLFSNLVGNLAYNLIATDPAGCILDTNIFLPQDNATLQATFDQSVFQNISCFGSSDGSAAISNINGGINPPSGGLYDVFWLHTDGTVINGITNAGNGANDTVNNLYGGNWQVQVVEQTSGCAWSRAFVIAEPDSLELSIIPNNPTCPEKFTGSIQMNVIGGTAPFVYEILDDQSNPKNTLNTGVANLLSAGFYSYSVIDANGCGASGEVILIDPERIDITYNKTDILCFGRNTGAVDITNVINFTGDFDSLQYIWSPSITGGDGLGKTSEFNMSPQTYNVIVTDQNGCTESFNISIKDTIPIELIAQKKVAYCRISGGQSGNGVVFATASGGAGNFSFKWDYLETGESTNTTTWAGRNPGTYQLTVIDGNNCIVSTEIELDSVSPIAAFTPVSNGFTGPALYEGTEQLAVEFINQSMFTKDSSNLQDTDVFEWNLFTNEVGGSNWFTVTDIDEVVDTVYGGEQIYNVCLVAKNFNGCLDTACTEIIVRKKPVLITPNVFTPGASPNNTFFFPGEGIEELDATVFNRYGIKVYEFKSPSDQWDGKHFKSGNDCTDGVYFYVYRARSTNGTEFSGEGNVTLIRSK